MKGPIFRFKGYTDDWEQRKLGDVLSLENGYAFQSEFFTDEKTGRIVTTPGNVSVDGGFIRSGGKNYSAQGPCPNKFIFQSGDIFVTMTDLTPSANTLGKPAIVPSDGCTYLHNQRLGKLTNLDCDRDFLFSLLCTDMYHAEIVKTASGTTVKHSSPNRILNYEAYFPKFEEQVIIGHYFDKLDNLITLHQRKCEAFAKLKKGMLQKMFPKNGKKVPEFRFKGFTGDWVQRKLGDCCREFKSGSFITASAIEESGEYPVFGGNGLRGYTSEYNHDGEFALIGRQGALCGNMNYSTGKAYFTEHAVAVQTNDSADTKFMYYLLGKMKLGQYSDQSAQPGLAVGKLVTMNELFPTVEEQKKIGEMLTSLDNLITLHQRKCDELKNMKKGLLQKMFI